MACTVMTGGDQGQWRVTGMSALRGAALAEVSALRIKTGDADDGLWTLRGTASHVRYATRGEVGMLRASQEPLGRPEALCAALIPIRKNAAWWGLAQDERRAIFEEQSHHTAIGMRYLPAVARQLYHCRDLGEPFDFLTWFEFAPEASAAFDDLLAALRGSAEWAYVEREVEIRLEWSGSRDAVG